MRAVWHSRIRRRVRPPWRTGCLPWRNITSTTVPSPRTPPPSPLGPWARWQGHYDAGTCGCGHKGSSETSPTEESSPMVTGCARSVADAWGSDNVRRAVGRPWAVVQPRSSLPTPTLSGPAGLFDWLGNFLRTPPASAVIRNRCHCRRRTRIDISPVKGPPVFSAQDAVQLCDTLQRQQCAAKEILSVQPWPSATCCLDHARTVML